MNTVIITLKKEISRAEFVAGYVDIPKFAGCCMRCKGYGRTWACPPYDFDVSDFWNDYSSVLLYGKKVIVPQEMLDKVYEPDELKKAYYGLLKPVKRDMLDELFDMERQYEGSTALSSGGCDFCEKCARLSDKPCVHPEKKRYSVESIGGDVVKSLKELFNEEVVWASDGRLPEHYILLGALLKK